MKSVYSKMDDRIKDIVDILKLSGKSEFTKKDLQNAMRRTGLTNVNTGYASKIIKHIRDNSILHNPKKNVWVLDINYESIANSIRQNIVGELVVSCDESQPLPLEGVEGYIVKKFPTLIEKDIKCVIGALMSSGFVKKAIDEHNGRTIPNHIIFTKHPVESINVPAEKMVKSETPSVEEQKETRKAIKEAHNKIKSSDDENKEYVKNLLSIMPGSENLENFRQFPKDAKIVVDFENNSIRFDYTPTIPTPEEIYKVAEDHGWHENHRPIPEAIALMHSELSEALEGHRTGVGKDEKGGLGEEFADCIIRILDTCHEYNVDIYSHIIKKFEYNKTRPYKHGGKKC